MNHDNSSNEIDSVSVKNCWHKINSGDGVNAFVDKFYQLMFESYPETQKLFPENLIELKTSLLATLDSVINGIDYIDDLKDELFDLGQRHKNMGIKKEMYDAFILTVVKAAKTSSDHRLTTKELQAWEQAFNAITKLVLKAY